MVSISQPKSIECCIGLRKKTELFVAYKKQASLAKKKKKKTGLK
jgi:hypothetical protein